MTTEFDSNTFEHDYILALLDRYREECQNFPESEPRLTDKYALQFTAFMNGQIVAEVRKAEVRKAKEKRLESILKTPRIIGFEINGKFHKLETPYKMSGKNEFSAFSAVIKRD